eukprot:GHVN01083094.1.p1 GENE.GHVN01083094.1~~GHVN01083094.1.p1  ORF type:complete len:809 (-),score=157.15 GHVN01083094.1:235-2397(-)
MQTIASHRDVNPSSSLNKDEITNKHNCRFYGYQFHVINWIEPDVIDTLNDVSSEDACDLACQNTVECVAWQYDASPLSWPTAKRCLLFNDFVGMYQSNPWTISGAPQCVGLKDRMTQIRNPKAVEIELPSTPNIDCMHVGHGISGVHLHLGDGYFLHSQVPHVDACMQVCQLTYPCIAWEYYPHNLDCILYEDVAPNPRYEAPEAISGPRDCYEGKYSSVLNGKVEPSKGDPPPHDMENIIPVFSSDLTSPRQDAMVSYCPSVEVNVDYMGFDLEIEGGSAIQKVRCPSDCLNLCRSSVGCSFWTHSEEQSICYLKSHAKGRVRSSTMGVITSGPIWCHSEVPQDPDEMAESKSCFGELFEHNLIIQGDIYDPDNLTGSRVVESPRGACEEACVNTPSCLYFRHDKVDEVAGPDVNPTDRHGLCALYSVQGEEIDTEETLAKNITPLTTEAPTTTTTMRPTTTQTDTTSSTSSTSTSSNSSTSSTSTKSTTQTDRSTEDATTTSSTTTTKAPPEISSTKPPGTRIVMSCKIIGGDINEITKDIQSEIALTMGVDEWIINIYDIIKWTDDSVLKKKRRLEEDDAVIVDWEPKDDNNEYPDWESWKLGWEKGLNDSTSVIRRNNQIDLTWPSTRLVDDVPSTRPPDEGPSTTNAPGGDKSSGGLSPWGIVGIVAAVLLVAAIALFIAFRMRKNRDGGKFRDTGGGLTPGQMEAHYPTSPTTG